MDFSDALNAMMVSQRAKEFASSDQLSLGELVLKLEAIKDKTKPIVFDFGNSAPCGLDSWRGVYAELSLHYGDVGKTSVSDVLGWLKDANGKTFEGYKGGDFTMSRQTPIWVANYGESGVVGYKGSEEYHPSVMVVDVVDGDTVTIITTAKD